MKHAASAIGISERSAYRWLARYRAEGDAGLVDRLGGMTEAVEEMRALLRQPADAQLRLVDYPAPQNSFDKALKFVSKLEQTATRIEGVRTQLEPLLNGESLYAPVGAPQ